METYFDYLRAMAPALGARIVETYPALQSPKDAPAPTLQTLLRTPLPAQALAITGLAKYLKKARAARIVAECGAGKTFMSLGTMHVHAGTKPYTALVMCPPHIVHKWAREALLTVPHARAFIVEDLRNGGDPKNAHGIVEVKLEKGSTVVKGIATTLPKLRSMGRKGWRQHCPGPAFFIMGKEKGKLGYFWKHAFGVAKCGRELGGLINPGYRSRRRLGRRWVRQQRGPARSQVQRDLQGRKRGNNSLLTLVAGGPREDPAHGSTRFHWPLHEGLVGLCGRR